MGRWRGGESSRQDRWGRCVWEWMGGAGVCGSRLGSRMVVRGGGSGSGSGSGSGMEWRVGVRR